MEDSSFFVPVLRFSLLKNTHADGGAGEAAVDGKVKGGYEESKSVTNELGFAEVSIRELL